MSTRIFRTLDEARGQVAPSALAIGNFDGVHIGHQALLAEAKRTANETGETPSVLTFHPHPTAVVAPDRTPPLISTLEQRLELLKAAGAEQILVLPFTSEVAALTPEEFVSQVLVDILKAKSVFVGLNFRFARKQAGTPEVLEQLGKQFGFEARFIQPVTWRGECVSSSVIREYIKNGNVSRAGRLLGRCFFVEGDVIAGRGVGSKQLVPTLNVRPQPQQVLPRGIYVTETIDATRNRRWHSITNVGTSPTFGTNETMIETYLLSEFDGLTPENIRVDFRLFLRWETWFPTVEDLRVQILKDVARAQTYWRRATRQIS
ncbi:MAG TPA: bifunctional riboflavin kinase/FAD synthetase [Bryobacteraceae bacterium]|jgi:riboflavin kinase/FMN adenylyltransferase|nr:bifunctional riboflavin kinase/FAD synthetase [Bryobacteraceae bacterium]